MPAKRNFCLSQDLPRLRQVVLQSPTVRCYVGPLVRQNYVFSYACFFWTRVGCLPQGCLTPALQIMPRLAARGLSDPSDPCRDACGVSASGLSDPCTMALVPCLAVRGLSDPGLSDPCPAALVPCLATRGLSDPGLSDPVRCLLRHPIICLHTLYVSTRTGKVKLHTFCNFFTNTTTPEYSSRQIL